MEILSKPWYLEFYYPHPITGKKSRAQIKSGKEYGLPGEGNRIKNKKKRQEFLQTLLNLVNQYLKKGWRFKNKVEPEIDTRSIKEGLLEGLETKDHLAKLTLKDYRDRTNRFIKNLEQIKIADQPIQSLQESHINNFLIQQAPNLSNASNFNNYLSVIKLILSAANVYLKIKIKKRRTISSLHKAYPLKLLKKVLNVSKEYYPKLYLCQLLPYYCLIRVCEARRIRTNNMILDQKILHIPPL